jgi:hypothetical protein
VEERSDQPSGGAYVYRLTDEAAYLQTHEDKKPEPIRDPPDPGLFKCWFCRKPRQQVQMLFGADIPVRDPNNFSNEMPIFICNECVAKFAEWFARKVSGAAP